MSVIHLGPQAVPGTAPAVPGGAPVVVAPGSPAICTALAADASLRGLADTLNTFAASSGASDDADQLRQTASDLTNLAAASNGSIQAALNDSASALDSLAEQGMSDTAEVANLTQQLTTLGDEVQAACHFPVG